MSETDLESLEASLEKRLDAITESIRKQGRASVAAHAAAESCLQGVRELQAKIDEPSALGPLAPLVPLVPTARNDRSESLQFVRSLLPFADSLDRAVELSRTSTSPPPTTWLSRLLGLAPAPSPHTEALATGLALLQQQFRSILGELGVDVESRSHIPVDPNIHRVVEVRSAPDIPPNTPPDTVLEVLRPGYAFQGIRLREADVVAAGIDPTPSSKRLET